MIGKIFRWLWDAIKNFFSSKSGKEIVEAGAAAGLAAVGVGGAKVAKAKKENKQAKAIQERAMQRLDNAQRETEAVLEGLGQTELDTMKTFSDFSNAVARIQSRPKFDATVSGVSLPLYDPVEYKKLAVDAELVIGSAGGALTGTAIGVAIIGIDVLALGPGILAGGMVFCAKAHIIEKQAIENKRQARQMERDVDRILDYYKELRKTASRHEKDILNVRSQYDKYLHKMQRIVDKKTDWPTYSEKEKQIIKNTVLLAGLLYKMCRIELVVKAEQPNVVETVYQIALEAIQEEATTVLLVIKENAV